MHRLLFILGNALVAYIAAASAHIAMRDREPWRWVLATLAVFPVVILAVVFILGTLGHLTAVSAVGLLALVALALFVIQNRIIKTAQIQSNPPAQLFEPESFRSIYGYVSIGVLAVVLGVLFSKTCLSGTSFFWDDLNYHAAAPAHWLTEGRLSLAPFNYHAYFPLNAEIFSLWFMLPFYGDGLVSLSCLYWGILSVAAIFVLCSVLGASGPTSALTAALAVVSYMGAKWIVTFTAADIAAPAMVLAAIALTVTSSGDIKMRAADAFYCGLLSGYAAGCKASFAPVVIILFVAVVYSCRQSSGKWVRVAMVFIMAAFATGAYWYIRNLILTGNPLFPAEVGSLFDGPFGIWQQNRSKLITKILAAPTDLKRWGFLLDKYMDWPHVLGLLAVLGYASGIYWWFNRSKLSSEEKRFYLLLLIGLVLMAIYPFTPFSGTVDRPWARLRVVRRFVIAPYSIGLVLFSPLVDRQNAAQKFWRLLFIIAAAVTLSDFFIERLDISGALSGCIIVGLWVFFTYVPLSVKMRRIAVSALILIILGALSLWQPYAQQLTDEKIFTNRDIEISWCDNIGGAWRFLETVPAGSRIAPFGSADWLYYPVFGRKYQLEPVFLRKHLHRYWLDEGSFWDGWIKGQRWGASSRYSWCYTGRDIKTFMEDLSLAEVDYVMITREDEEVWPYPKEMLLQSGRAEVVYAGGCSIIWKITK